MSRDDKTQINFWCTKGEKEEYDSYAAQLGVTLSQVIRKSLPFYCKWMIQQEKKALG